MITIRYLNRVRSPWRLFVKTFSTLNVAFCALLFSLILKAGPEVLPSGINSPMFNYGIFQNLEQRFENNGLLWRIGDLRSIEYDATYLSKVSPEAKNLITALNAFGQSHGQFINYGVLKFEITPRMEYFAPIYAYGISSKWTIGVGLPIVTYETTVSMQTENSNLESYKSVYLGRVSEQLDRALNLDIKTETLKTIEQLGYKPLAGQKQQFLADVQVVSVYKFQQTRQYDLFYLTTLSLPTGPAYDADDLLALNTFGLASIENTIATTLKSNFGLNFSPYLGYQYVLGDSVTARVPLNEEDTLPDSSRKERVQRQIGGKWIVKTEGELKTSESLIFSSAYTQTQKAADNFEGNQGSRYDLLSKNTYAREEIYSFKISYNTIKSYFRKKALFPFIVGYELSDLFKGENVNRRTLHEFNFKMFF